MENNVNEFKDFLKKGPENYILTLQKVGGVNQLYSEYFENIEKIKDVFDLYGGFTTYIYEDFNAYFDKSLREEPMDSFNTFCKKSFGDLDYKIQMAFIFRDKEGIYIRE